MNQSGDITSADRGTGTVMFPSPAFMGSYAASNETPSTGRLAIATAGRDGFTWRQVN